MKNQYNRINNVISMNTINTNICRWGNSRGVRLPKTILDIVGIKDDDEVSLTVNDGSIIIKKAVSRGELRPYPSLADRFASYKDDYVPEEWDTGPAVGKEI